MRFSKTQEQTTHEGGVAYTLSNKQELIKVALTSFLQKDFYTSQSDKLTAIQDLVKGNNSDWCLKLSRFSRAYGLRTINHVIFIESIRDMKGQKGVRDKIAKYLLETVRRPDEILDIVGYYALRNGQNHNSIILPNALKYGIKLRMEAFTEYQLSKYKARGDDINVYDVVNMVHAKSNVIDKLMKGTIADADTWERELSTNGNNKESWTRLLKEEKLGAIATIRNLRNILDAGVENTLVCEYLDKIKWDYVFPFQAIQALDMLEGAGIFDPSIQQTVLKHVKESFKHITETYKGKIAIGVDVSGSMFDTSVTGLSKMDRAKMAIMYGMILKELTDGDLYLWSASCEKVNSDVFGEVMKQGKRMSKGTYIEKFTDTIKGKGYDYAIILTDEQTSDFLENVANKQTIVWGLHDYENTIVNGKNTVYFTGYNDIMWKVGADLFRLGELEKVIDKI